MRKPCNHPHKMPEIRFIRLKKPHSCPDFGKHDVPSKELACTKSHNLGKADLLSGFRQKNTLVTRRVSQLGHNEGFFNPRKDFYYVYYILSTAPGYFKDKKDKISITSENLLYFYFSMQQGHTSPHFAKHPAKSGIPCRFRGCYLTSIVI
jgi:hypothetical protein